MIEGAAAWRVKTKHPLPPRSPPPFEWGGRSVRLAPIEGREREVGAEAERGREEERAGTGKEGGGDGGGGVTGWVPTA